MTSSGPGDRGRSSRQDGPFTLRPLIDDVPLPADESQTDVQINCVDYYGRLAPDATKPSAKWPWLTMQRSQLVRWYQCIRAATLCPNPTGPQRSIQPPGIHPSLTTVALLYRTVWSVIRVPPRGPADPHPTSCRKGLHPLQLDGYILLPARAEPGLRQSKAQGLQLDRRC